MPNQRIALQNTINVKSICTGTDVQNKVSERDLAFWLPKTQQYIRDDLPKVSTFEELVKLPVAQIGHILSIVVQIMRKGRIVNGERFSNSTLKGKAETWQRLIRNRWQKEDSEKALFDPNCVPRAFDM